MNSIFGAIESYDEQTRLGIILALGNQRFPFHASALPEGFIPEVGAVVRFCRTTWATQIVPDRLER